MKKNVSQMGKSKIALNQLVFEKGPPPFLSKRLKMLWMKSDIWVRLRLMSERLRRVKSDSLVNKYFLYSGRSVILCMISLSLAFMVRAEAPPDLS